MLNTEEQFRFVVESVPNGIILVDDKGKIILANSAIEKVFGYSKEEIIGKSVDILVPDRFQNSHRQDREAYQRCPQKRAMGAGRDLHGRRKDGTEFPVEIGLNPVETESGTVIVGSIIDITQRRQAEAARENAEKELVEQRTLSIRSDRLRSLGEMAAGIAHELNQPLVGVRGLAEHLLVGMDRNWDLSSDKCKEKLKLILEQSDRMSSIIQNIRKFAREADNPERSLVNVNEVIDWCTDLLGAQLQSRGIQLTLKLADDLQPVLANPYSLEEVIINILINARDATEEKMKLNSDSTGFFIMIKTHVNGGKIYIEIQDEGIGIPNAIQDKVFDPFFTTKEPDDGTGLGLSISKSIVEEFHGTLNITSTENAGTTAVISLPVNPSEE
jgi:PAS domain S-box-containing protein